MVAPGVYDALTALIAEQAGFATLYVSGAAIAYSKLGRPDIGLVSMSEVADTVALIRDRVAADLIVDADTGYGNALNVRRTVRLFERAGARAIQLEDQDFPKRCGHLDGKALIPAGEMAGKIKAALDARRSSDTLIIARTDAVAVEGFERAIERALLYQEAGADMLFEQFKMAEAACRKYLDAGWITVGNSKRHLMALPAYDQCIKASHVFNLLDARGVISVTERQSYILRVRELAKACGEAWLATEAGGGSA